MSNGSVEEERSTLSSSLKDDKFSKTTEGDEDSDWTSSSGSSSEDDADDNQTQNIRAVPVNSKLKGRLESFLPQLEKANKDLSDPAQAFKRQIDDIAESDEEYVEMNLGLGVLSEKQQGEDEIKVHQPDTDDSKQDTITITKDLPSGKMRGQKIEEV